MMTIEIIRDRLASYHCTNELEEEHALKEITQEVILMGLARQNFFDEAEFHGGTALRILYGLQRFSEDLDFALLKPNKKFSLAPFLEHIKHELSAFGYEFEIVDRDKADSTVKKAFLKDDSIGRLLLLKAYNIKQKIKIKIEVDSNPPFGATTEIKYLYFPSSFGIQAKDLPSSFSGKLHALLCRKYVKGRDWFDFIWYAARKTSINFILLANALQQQGPWQGQELNIDKCWVHEQLKRKIESIDWSVVAKDIAPFLKPIEQESLKLWGKDFFIAILNNLND